jgi:hypothetical protein
MRAPSVCIRCTYFSSGLRICSTPRRVSTGSTTCSSTIIITNQKSGLQTLGQRPMNLNQISLQPSLCFHRPQLRTHRIRVRRDTQAFAESAAISSTLTFGGIQQYADLARWAGTESCAFFWWTAQRKEERGYRTCKYPSVLKVESKDLRLQLEQAIRPNSPDNHSGRHRRFADYNESLSDSTCAHFVIQQNMIRAEMQTE